MFDRVFLDRVIDLIERSLLMRLLFEMIMVISVQLLRYICRERLSLRHEILRWMSRLHRILIVQLKMSRHLVVFVVHLIVSSLHLVETPFVLVQVLLILHMRGG